MLKIIQIILICTFSQSSVANTWSVKHTTISQTLEKSYLSTQGKEIGLHRLMNAEPSEITYRFYIQAGLHGNEVDTSLFADWLMRRIKNNKGPLAELPAGTLIDIVPKASPDTYKVSRYNKNDVNLNRNFSVLWGKSREAPGASAFSEKETQAVRALFEKQRYHASIDIHGYINWIVVPSPPSFIEAASNSLKKKYHEWSRSVLRHLQGLRGYELKKAGELGDGGAFEDWAFWSQGTLSLCLEMTRFPSEKKFVSYEKFISKSFDTAIEITNGGPEMVKVASKKSEQ